MKRPHRARKYKHFKRDIDAIIASPDTPRVYLYENTKKVIFSDWHISDHSDADNFKQNISLAAGVVFPRYSDRDVILVGDMLELWEAKAKHIFRHPKNHAIIYWLKRLTSEYVLGNHDKKAPKTGWKMPYSSGLLFLDGKTEKLLAVLIHGHQADKWNCGGWLTGIARWFVRYPWTWLQKAFNATSEPPEFSPAKNILLASQIEKHYVKYAKDKGIVLICGHTHRAVKTNHYINVGSGVKLGLIQCVEINGKEFVPVTWRET